jgi:acyl-CoA synthetase (AMP-forming)/AMP-acid ligase II
VPTDTATVVELLDWAAGHREIGVRLLERGERESWRSWASIRAGALEVCGGLQALGVEPAETVATVFPTGYPFLEALFGVLLAGAVPVPLYPPVRLGRLDEYQRRTAAMLRAARARVVLADRRVRRLLGPAVLAADPPLGCLELEALPPGQARIGPVSPDGLGLVQFSSGTTVEPKPVALAHRALVAQARLLNAHWPDREGAAHSGVSWLPLYHDMGLIGCILPALERPGPLTLIPPEEFIVRPAVWLQAISRYRATISPAPNFAYALCTRKVRDDEMDGVDLSSWQVAINGAETVVPDVVRAFTDRFARWGFRPTAMTPVYGLSEAALAVTFSDPWQPCRSRRFDRGALADGRAVPADHGLELVSVGRPLPGFELAIVDGRPGRLADGQVGRVLVRGPSLMTGYLHQEEATTQALRDGWLDTGDRGFLLDGELHLTGRDKEVLIVNGQNHAPEELERATESVAGVRAGCAVAVAFRPEGAVTDEVLLLVESAHGVPLADRSVISRRCAEQVLAATGVLPARVGVFPPGTLPRTSSGKLRRQEALRLFLAGSLQPPRKVTARLLAAAAARSGLAFLWARLRRGGRRGPA